MDHAADLLLGADSRIVADLVTGNHILFQQNIVDAFGHISVRHDKDPNRYIISRHLAPGLVTQADLRVYDLDSRPLHESTERHYSERFIHGEIYRLRPDVVSIVHCHAAPLIPFGATRTGLRPIYHMSGFLGCGCAHYEIRDVAGMSDMLVRDATRARALASCLGDKPMALMRGHGATIVGHGIRQAVYRAIYATNNATLQMEALRLGTPIFLEEEEARLAAEGNDKSLDRAWNLWATALEET